MSQIERTEERIEKRTKDLMCKIEEAVKEGADKIQETIIERKEAIEGMLDDTLGIITDEFGKRYSDWVHDLMMEELQDILTDQFLSTREMDYQQTLQYDIDF